MTLTSRRRGWEDPLVWEGITGLLDDYARVRADDVAVLAYTSDSRDAAARVSVVLESRGVETRRVWMKPLRDVGFLERFRAALPPPAELRGRLVVLTFERDTKSHDSVLDQALAGYDTGRCAVIRVISTCPDLFAGALRVTPAELAARNAALLRRLGAAESLVIETPGGSELAVTLENRRYQWVSNHGRLRAGTPLFLPPGEIATFPASIDGVFVADFAYNVNMVTDRDVRLSTYPVKVEVRGGRAVAHECADAIVSRFVADCFARESNASLVGELGFGTNPGVDAAVALNSHINERRPGVHLGFGEHNQSPRAVAYACRIHLDLIARGGRIWVDRDPVPIDLERLDPSQGEDLAGSVDELPTECCGTSALVCREGAS